MSAKSFAVNLESQRPKSIQKFGFDLWQEICACKLAHPVGDTLQMVHEVIYYSQMFKFYFFVSVAATTSAGRK